MIFVFFFFLLYPPFASPFLLSETGRHSHLSLVNNLPFSPFLFPLSLSFLPFRHHQERERGKGKGERERLPVGESCEQRRDNGVDKAVEFVERLISGEEQCLGIEAEVEGDGDLEETCLDLGRLGTRPLSFLKGKIESLAGFRRWVSWV